MLDVILTVADRLISLLKVREERDRKLYEDFLVEFGLNMEALHQNYLETFAKYREALESTNTPLTVQHPLIGMIERDILFTDQIRARVRALSEYQDDPGFGLVAKAAASYLLGGPTSAHVLINGRRLMNAPRNSAIDGLKQLFAQSHTDQEKMKVSADLLDRIVGDLQLQYGSFLRAFTSTKRKLLDRRV